MQKRLISLSLLVVLAAGAAFSEPPSSSSTAARPTSGIDTLQGIGASLPAVNAASAAQPSNVGGQPGGGMMGEHREMSGMMMAACVLFGLMVFVALALFIVLEVLWIKVWRQRLHRPATV